MRSLRRQNGVALLIVLVLVALAAVLATGMLERQHIDLRRAANLVFLDQARQYALGAESWALGLLDDDVRTNRTDSAQDDWAAGLVTLPVEGGTISGRIIDLQGRFNLNNLVNAGKHDVLARDRLAELFNLLELSTEPLAALLDWLDADSQVTGPAGAEDDYYSRLDPGYRAANHRLVDVSELRSIRGLGAGYVEKLDPLVTALPAATALNVNSAPKSVLQALGLSAEQADAVLERRNEKPFGSVNAMMELPELAGSELDRNRLGVSSRYFLLDTAVRLDQIQYVQRSLIERQGPGRIRVLWRRRGEW